MLTGSLYRNRVGDGEVDDERFLVVLGRGRAPSFAEVVIVTPSNRVASVGRRVLIAAVDLERDWEELDVDDETWQARWGSPL